MSQDAVYESNVQVEREYGTIRTAHLPAEDDPITFGVHSEVVEHYGVDTEEDPPRHYTGLPGVGGRRMTDRNLWRRAESVSN